MRHVLTLVVTHKTDPQKGGQISMGEVRMPAMTFTEKVAAYFLAHEGEWLDGELFRPVGGKYAYRSRISDCRTNLGMHIENRKRLVGRRDGTPCADCVSEYRYLAPKDDKHVSDAADLNTPWGLRS